MESTAIAEELNQLFRDIEREVDIPKGLTHRFGKWDRLKELVQDIADQVQYAEEEIETLENDVHQLEEKLKEIEDELDDILHDIRTCSDGADILISVEKELENIKDRI